MSIESFQRLADELLYASFQKKDEKISPLLFATLQCATDPPSTPQKLIAWHRKLKTYLEQLKGYDQKENHGIYVASGN